MSVNKFVSDIKYINHNNEVVFNYLGNLNNFKPFFNEYTLAQLSQQIPALKITDVKCDNDNCLFTISDSSEGGVQVVERNPFKTIKFRGVGKIPFELNIWIQLLPSDSYKTKMRLTIHADLNMMMKMMLGKKLKEGVDKLADAICLLPYH
jgi:carbon monoxide dehydrogenase subunit G